MESHSSSRQEQQRPREGGSARGVSYSTVGEAATMPHSLGASAASALDQSVSFVSPVGAAHSQDGTGPRLPQVLQLRSCSSGEDKQPPQQLMCFTFDSTSDCNLTPLLQLPRGHGHGHRGSGVGVGAVNVGAGVGVLPPPAALRPCRAPSASSATARSFSSASSGGPTATGMGDSAVASDGTSLTTARRRGREGERERTREGGEDLIVPAGTATKNRRGAEKHHLGHARRSSSSGGSGSTSGSEVGDDDDDEEGEGLLSIARTEAPSSGTLNAVVPEGRCKRSSPFRHRRHHPPVPESLPGGIVAASQNKSGAAEPTATRGDCDLSLESISDDGGEDGGGGDGAAPLHKEGWARWGGTAAAAAAAAAEGAVSGE